MKSVRLSVVAMLAFAAACDSNPAQPVESNPTAAVLSGVMPIVGSVTGSAHFLAFSLDQCLIGNPGCPAPKGIATRNMSFQAMKAADGSVSGSWQSTAGSAILHGTIDCLTIAADGKSARMSGLVTMAKGTLFQPGTAFAMEVFDNGAGGSGVPDESTAIRPFRNLAPEVGRAFCETGDVPDNGELPVIPSDQGNVTIRVTS